MSIRTFINVDTSVSSAQPGHVTGTNVTNGSHRIGLDVVAIDGLDRIHTRTHQGKAYTLSHNFILNDQANGDILLDLTSSTIHIAFQASVGGNSRLELFEGVTVSGNGTEISAVNNNRNSANVAAHKFYFSPTVSNVGTTLASFYLPGGDKNAAIGGSGGGLPRAGAEWVLAPSTKYLMRVTNLVGSTTTISSSFSYYES